MTAVHIPSTGDAEDTGYERERQRKLDDEMEEQNMNAPAAAVTIQKTLREEADRLEIIARIMRLAAERIDVADGYAANISEALNTGKGSYKP